MPRGDGTGPMGAGPMTGRAAGFCAGYASPGFANPVAGRRRGFGMSGGMGMAWGRGRGAGFGFRNRFNAPVPMPVSAPGITADQEKEYLENEIAALKNEQDAVKKRLEELKDKK